MYENIASEEIKKNKELLSKYPFLLPRNVFTDELPENYDYSFTELDNLPIGWKIAFGEQLCEELADELNKNGLIDKYRILQIKEKFGFLHWYDNGGTEKTNDIICKYEDISSRTCINCGNPATKISLGWVSPFCDDCASKLTNVRFVPIEDFFNNL